MINQDRIVSVTRTDLITLYANMLTIAGTSLTKASADAPGVFNLASGSGNIIADEPIKSFDFGSGVSAAVVYFIPGFDFEGFSVAGTAITASGAEVDADSASLYTATLASGAVTIAKVGF